MRSQVNVHRYNEIRLGRLADAVTNVMNRDTNEKFVTRAYGQRRVVVPHGDRCEFTACRDPPQERDLGSATLLSYPHEEAHDRAVERRRLGVRLQIRTHQERQNADDEPHQPRAVSGHVDAFAGTGP